MHAFAPHGQGDIDAVVDKQRNVMGPRHLEQTLGNADQLGGAAGFVAKLHDGDAASAGLVDDVDEVAVAEDGRGRVRHQIERVVDPWPVHCEIVKVMAGNNFRGRTQGLCLGLESFCRRVVRVTVPDVG